MIKFHIFQPKNKYTKKKKIRSRLEKTTYKKNQFKAQFIQNGSKRTKIDRIDRRGPKLLELTKLNRVGLALTKLKLFNI